MGPESFILTGQQEANKLWIDCHVATFAFQMGRQTPITVLSGKEAEQVAVAVNDLGGTGGREGFRQGRGEDKEEKQDGASCYYSQSGKGNKGLFYSMLHGATCDASVSSPICNAWQIAYPSSSSRSTTSH
jgi:hypothetical protein